MSSPAIQSPSSLFQLSEDAATALLASSTDVLTLDKDALSSLALALPPNAAEAQLRAPGVRFPINFG